MENGPETDYNLANRCGYEFQTLACYKVVVIFRATCIFRFYFASNIKCYIPFCLKYMYFLLSVKIYIFFSSGLAECDAITLNKDSLSTC